MRLLHETSRALWHDAAMWSQACREWSGDEVAAMLGLSRWDTAIRGEGPIDEAELRHLRETNPEAPQRPPPASQPQRALQEPAAQRQRGRAVPQIIRAPDVPAQASIWELEGDAEAAATQFTPGGLQELELWLLFSQQRAAHEARRGVQTQGRGIVALQVEPTSTFEKAQVQAEYVPKAAVVAQANVTTNAGDRKVVAFLRTYDPDTHFMVVLVKDNCNPRRLIATYAYADLERSGQGREHGEG